MAKEGLKPYQRRPKSPEPDPVKEEVKNVQAVVNKKEPLIRFASRMTKQQLEDYHRQQKIIQLEELIGNHIETEKAFHELGIEKSVENIQLKEKIMRDKEALEELRPGIATNKLMDVIRNEIELPVKDDRIVKYLQRRDGLNQKPKPAKSPLSKLK